MPTKDQRRQKRLARKNAKRKAVHKELARRKQGGLAAELARVSTAPILDCLVSETVWTEGIGSVLLSRELRNGQVAFATFLVDLYCLGVKDTHVDICSRPAYREEVLQFLLDRGEYEEVTPEYLRKFVESAVEYALDLGFPPHRDYRIGKEIFGNIDASECDEEFEFGRDGEPCFMAGPHDSHERCQRIISILSARCGEGNFSFTIGMPGMQLIAGDDSYMESDDDDFDETDDNTVIGYIA